MMIASLDNGFRCWLYPLELDLLCKLDYGNPLASIREIIASGPEGVFEASLKPVYVIEFID